MVIGVWIFLSLQFFFEFFFSFLVKHLLCSVYVLGKLKSGIGPGHKKLKKCLPVFGKCFVYKYKGEKRNNFPQQKLRAVATTTTASAEAAAEKKEMKLSKRTNE